MFRGISQEGWWNKYQKIIIENFSNQPLIIIIRITNKELESKNIDPTISIINQLKSLGLRNIEIAWSSHQYWIDAILKIKNKFKNIFWGASSINSLQGLRTISELNFDYAMSPIWNESLQIKAIELNQILIPGVFSPSEIHYAIEFGWKIIKVFPASILGKNYINNVKVPIGGLPFVICAGGIKASELNSWLNGGYDSIVLGRELINNQEVYPLIKAWLEEHTK